jgi:predicted metal-dependent HD superfamily phosphohydrolase
MLKETFNELLNHYTNDTGLINSLWVEIEEQYSSKKRHYHTLEHLAHLLVQLNEVKGELKNQEAILFSLYYHDIIYNALRSDNEEKSAALAEKRMQQVSVPLSITLLCKDYILATKTHITSGDSDCNYFTDADLSILGQPWEVYEQYFKNVRKEYSVYPDLVYRPGRKKVLQHFLSMERIYKTDYFFEKFESSAKSNLGRELELL